MSAVEVEAVVTGRVESPVVVLCNSLGSTYHIWDAQLAALADRFRVIRYNTRGHGDSPIPSGPWVLDDLADDLVALLDRLDVAKGHLVGLSLGGMTAMRVAARNPERVNRMAILCSAARLPPAAGWTERAATALNLGTVAVAPAVVARWFTPAYLAANPRIRETHEAMVAATPSCGYALCCEVIAALDLRADLVAIKAPTLVIAGADDLATPPAKLREIVTAVHDAQLLVVPRAAHLANAERPDIITPALINHLERS
ncbi:3-oxoadipate enol-lactonase [Mycobacterium arosiense]|uniref:3-oxoadipate enol-lactonase n=1 Tax=Mycobacterium arosiense ATCC BAA-1401 = DSM 45069 TaxID=1265311 RepID=A0A1W9ZHI1_MYCAI|nr:3-oxoadipate enol-lactonase [Mycobacterium arosiense]ORA15170.1 3-oxoadipate enol-lactonase [Mycobacterium arosiense ATCC BAA-1401 = DSM 45069]